MSNLGRGFQSIYATINHRANHPRNRHRAFAERKKVKVTFHEIDTAEKNLLYQARHLLHWSTECFFHEAFDYAHEDRRIRCLDIQKKFIIYLNSGGAIIPPEVQDFSLDILAGRVNPHQTV